MDNENTKLVIPAKINQYKQDIGMSIVFTLITCGIYNLFWNNKQMKACNLLLGRQEFDFMKWLLFTFLTCGIYHIYYQYQMGTAIVEIHRKYNKMGLENLPVISALVSVFGLSIVVDCIHQSELNKYMN